MADKRRDKGPQEPALPAGEGQRIPPPLVSSPTELPFRDLSWTRFERLCRDVVSALGFKQVHRYGKPGQRQHGIDFRGISPDGGRFRFQAKQVAEISAAELRETVRSFAEGPLARDADTFVICMSVEGNEKGFRDELDQLQEEHDFAIEIWDAPDLTHRLRRSRDLVQTYFGQHWVERFFPTTASARQLLDAEALLLGPVEALKLGPKVKEAQQLVRDSPGSAAELYQEVADALRERFPRHADRFQQLRATALKEAGDAAASHDVLMDLAIRDLFERAEPELSSGVARGLDELRDSVDEVRQARGAAMILFGRWHEDPHALMGLAECFDRLQTDDPYASFIAALLSEAALADREYELALDRDEALRAAIERGDGQVALRVRIALADAGLPGAWPELIRRAEALRYPAADGTYVCLRGARWCAWNGQPERAESLYRLAMKLGAEADLDLDVENALWSLAALYSVPAQFKELLETRELAWSIDGSSSYVPTDPRKQERSYRHLANGKLPDALLWARYRLLDSIRSGCLMTELDSHVILARIYGQAGEPVAALEHAVLGGNGALVKEAAPQVGVWPEFLAHAVADPAPWVRPSALSAVGYVGDFAPPEVARDLAREIVRQLHDDADDMRLVPTLFQALEAVVLEATDDDLRHLVPMLERAAPREPDGFRPTDPAVGMVAARLYRFRPSFRRQAATVLAEMASGAHTNEWWRALAECGDATSELVEAMIRVAERERIDLAGPLSDLGHLNAATRTFWSRRLESVAEYPLGKRAQYQFGLQYDVPGEFLREQDEIVVHRYVEKLVAIGSDAHEPTMNRRSALGSVGSVVALIPPGMKKDLFDRLRPLTDQQLRTSEPDQFGASSQHPLSRVQISLGTATDIRAAVGWLLGRLAADTYDCSAVVEMGLAWLRSDDPLLQQVGASILTLPNLPAPDGTCAELANHANPSVRREALRVPDLRNSLDEATLERLASDSVRRVRIGVAYALSSVRATHPDSYDSVRATLNADPSAIVRAVAAEALASVG